MLVLLFASAAIADTLVLTDGTTLEGRVVPQGEKYWIKLATGESKMIAKSQVKAWNKSSPRRRRAAHAGLPNPPATAPATPANVALGFAETQSRANRVDAPLAAVGLWQAYHRRQPRGRRSRPAKAELEKWKQLDKDKAEKINGKWVGGEERKKLIEKVTALLRKPTRCSGTTRRSRPSPSSKKPSSSTPTASRPTSSWASLHLQGGGTGSNARLDQAIKSLEQATKLRPNSAAAWSNLAIAYNFRSKYEQSVLTAYKAAQIDDNKDVVQNLVNAIAQAAPGMRENNTKVRPIMEEAVAAGARARRQHRPAELGLRPARGQGARRRKSPRRTRKNSRARRDRQRLGLPHLRRRLRLLPAWCKRASRSKSM